MGRDIVVLLFTSASSLSDHEELTSVIHCKAAPSHFTGMAPDCVSVGIY